MPSTELSAYWGKQVDTSGLLWKNLLQYFKGVRDGHKQYISRKERVVQKDLLKFKKKKPSVHHSNRLMNYWKHLTLKLLPTDTWHKTYIQLWDNIDNFSQSLYHKFLETYDRGV